MTMLLLDRPFDDETLRNGDELELRNIGPKVWPTVLAECRARTLTLYNVTLQSLDGIERLSGIECLTIEWATKLTDVNPIFRMTRLRCLPIFDVPKVRSFEGIEALAKLVELNLSGSRGALTPKMRLSSLEPITRLQNLATFSLVNARLEDDDISSLARCSKLRELSLSNQFDRAQFAYLAKHLNRKLAKPISAYVSSSLRCETCHDRKVLIRGRRMPFLCRNCDETKLQARVQKFEQLVRDA